MRSRIRQRQVGCFALVSAALAMGLAGLATPATASSVRSPGSITSRAVGEADLTPERVLPHTSRVRPDGVREVQVNSEVISALTTAAATSGCGSTCDGLDPNYRFTPAGGPANWYTCADDAITAREAYLPGGSQTKVELRYSPRCRTAWTRAGYSFYISLTSYYLSGSYRDFVEAGRNPYEDWSAPHWTAMLNDAGLLAQACMYEDTLGKFCTSKY